MLKVIVSLVLSLSLLVPGVAHAGNLFKAAIVFGAAAGGFVAGKSSAAHPSSSRPHTIQPPEKITGILIEEMFRAPYINLRIIDPLAITTASTGRFDLGHRRVSYQTHFKNSVRLPERYEILRITRYTESKPPYYTTLIFEYIWKEKITALADFKPPQEE